MKKVEDIKHPLTKGDYYLVPCLTYEDSGKLYITPVINHPHTDIENGQKEIHYHVDYRFVRHKADAEFPTIINKHSKHMFVSHIRPQEGLHGKLEYFVLPMINESFTGVTPVDKISKSKLKHKCIHKGKCPHRGYDLSQVKDVDGIITCPLHGLKFNKESKKIINVK